MQKNQKSKFHNGSFMRRTKKYKQVFGKIILFSFILHIMQLVIPFIMSLRHRKCKKKFTLVDFWEGEAFSRVCISCQSSVVQLNASKTVNYSSLNALFGLIPITALRKCLLRFFGHRRFTFKFAKTTPQKDFSINFRFL